MPEPKRQTNQFRSVMLRRLIGMSEHQAEFQIEWVGVEVIHQSGLVQVLQVFETCQIELVVGLQILSMAELRIVLVVEELLQILKKVTCQIELVVGLQILL